MRNRRSHRSALRAAVAASLCMQHSILNCCITFYCSTIYGMTLFNVVVTCIILYYSILLVHFVMLHYVVLILYSIIRHLTIRYDIFRYITLILRLAGGIARRLSHDSGVVCMYVLFGWNIAAGKL